MFTDREEKIWHIVEVWCTLTPEQQDKFLDWLRGL